MMKRHNFVFLPSEHSAYYTSSYTLCGEMSCLVEVWALILVKYAVQWSNIVESLLTGCSEEGTLLPCLFKLHFSSSASLSMRLLMFQCFIVIVFMLVVLKTAQSHLRLEETPSAGLSKSRRQNDKGLPAAAVPLIGQMKSLMMLTRTSSMEFCGDA